MIRRTPGEAEIRRWKGYAAGPVRTRAHRALPHVHSRRPDRNRALALASRSASLSGGPPDAPALSTESRDRAGELRDRRRPSVVNS